MLLVDVVPEVGELPVTVGAGLGLAAPWPLGGGGLGAQSRVLGDWSRGQGAGGAGGLYRDVVIHNF